MCAKLGEVPYGPLTQTLCSLNKMETEEDIPQEAVEAMVNEDWHKAHEIISKLASRGNTNAEHFMGWFYEQGIEVPQSDKIAFEWWTKSANKGVPESQCALAQLYENGRGTNQSYVNAYVWYSHAIMSGDEESQTFINNLSNKMSETQLTQARSILHEQT